MRTNRMRTKNALFLLSGLLLSSGLQGCTSQPERNPTPVIGSETMTKEKQAEMMRRRLPPGAGNAAAKAILSHK